MSGSVFEEKPSFKTLALWFFSKLGWGSYIVSIAKIPSKKIGALIRCIKVLSPECTLYLCKSTIQPCMEYCCHVWVGASICYLDTVDKLQKWVSSAVGPTLAATLEPLYYRRKQLC